MFIIQYIILITTITYLTIYAYIKIKYPFWNNQPVLHSYDYWRFLYQIPFIIYKYRPIKTKFYKSNNIKTIPYLEISEEQKKEVLYLLQSNYISNDRILLTIEDKDLDVFIKGHRRQYSGTACKNRSSDPPAINAAILVRKLLRSEFLVLDVSH